ncbi:MAG: hypothetical protein EXR62_05280 [Chloroflexi bacterium]|nr:hypothetical protein [Chloroflexota bacterium]
MATGNLAARQQELLFQAAFLPGSRAVAAWQTWLSLSNIDTMDGTSSRLLPQLYRNLLAAGADDPLMGKIKGFYRYTWTKNQVWLQQAEIITAALSRAGVETVALGNLAIALLWQENLGCWPIKHLDILVRQEMVTLAAQVISRLGWRPRFRLAGTFGENGIGMVKKNEIRHIYWFGNTSGETVCLYRRPLPVLWSAANGDDFWSGALTTQVQQVTLRFPDPAGQLLLLLSPDGTSEHRSRFQRAASTMMVLTQTQHTIDWTRLLSMARRYHLALPLNDTLQYVQRLLHTPAPAVVMAEIQSLAAQPRERVIYLLRTQAIAWWHRWRRRGTR